MSMVGLVCLVLSRGCVRVFHPCGMGGFVERRSRGSLPVVHSFFGVLPTCAYGTPRTVSTVVRPRCTTQRATPIRTNARAGVPLCVWFSFLLSGEWTKEWRNGGMSPPLSCEPRRSSTRRPVGVRVNRTKKMSIKGKMGPHDAVESSIPPSPKII